MLLSLELTRSGAAALLAEPSGTPRQTARRTFASGLAPAQQWLELIKLAREVCFQEVVDAGRLTLVALAFEGPLSSAGQVLKSPYAVGWEGYDLRRGLREHLQVPHAEVLVAPRVMAEAIGETSYGGWHGQYDWLFIHLGSALESVASVRGHLVESDLSALVVERDGSLDDFGRRGTLGAYCGGLAFEARARTYSLSFAKAHEVWAMAESNFAARSLADDYVSRLAQGLSCALALLKPHQICISGPFGRAIWPLIHEAVALKLREVAGKTAVDAVEFRVSSLGEDGATLGMLALALDAGVREAP